jgi:hypothetical protein
MIEVSRDALVRIKLDCRAPVGSGISPLEAHYGRLMEADLTWTIS